MMNPNVAIDLDGTILFPSEAEICLPGRSRNSYISQANADALVKIGNACNLYIATARNGTNVAKLLSLLPPIKFAGFVFEGGLVDRHSIDDAVVICPLKRKVELQLEQYSPDWASIPGYEKLICLLPGSHSQGSLRDVTAKKVYAAFETNDWSVHRERNKIIGYRQPLLKFHGLKRLGVSQLQIAAGDSRHYDKELLNAAALPMTLPTACAAIRKIVSRKNGFQSAAISHRGASEILNRILQVIGA